jgi:hypothetical protein
MVRDARGRHGSVGRSAQLLYYSDVCRVGGRLQPQQLARRGERLRNVDVVTPDRR